MSDNEIPYAPYNPTDEELKLMFSWEKIRGKNIVTPDSTKFAEQFISRYYPVNFKNKVYLFDTKKRIYFEENNTIKQWVREQVIRMSHLLLEPQVRPLSPGEKNAGELNNPDYYTLPKGKLDPILKDVYAQVAATGGIEGDKFPFNQFNGIAVNNGVVVFNKFGMPKRIERTHHHMYTRYIPVDYNPDADTEKVIEVLSNWLPDDDHNWLVQIMAQAMFQSLPGVAPFKQSYLLLGKPNSGKTSFSNLLQKMVGGDNFATHMLHELGDAFTVATLPYKMFCFGDDLPFVKIDAGNKFKTLTGKRTMMVNPKFGKPYEADITAVFAFSANYAPQLVPAIEDDSGWWDRWAVIKFTGGPFDKDPTWEETTFTKEFMEGMLLLSILEVSYIISNHGKMRLRMNPDDVKKIWVGDAQLFKEQFFNRYIEVTDDDAHWIEVDNLLDTINAWMGGKFYNAYITNEQTETKFLERMPTTKPALTDAMSKAGVFKKAMMDDGHIIRPYFNVKWNDSAKICEWCHTSAHSV